MVLSTVSPVASEAMPVLFSSANVEYFDVVGFREAGRAMAIAKSSYGRRYSIRLLNFATNRSFPLVVSDEGESFQSLAVSSDGSRFAYVSRKTGRSGCATRIRVFDRATDSRREIGCSNGERLGTPYFSPFDGRLYVEKWNANEKLILAFEGLDSPSVFMRSTRTENVRNIRFSVSGSHLLFLKNQQIFVRSSNSDSEVSVSSAEERAYEPRWSRDGTRISYWAENEDQQAVFVFELETAASRAVAFITVPEQGEADFFGRQRDRVVCPSIVGQQVFFSAHSGIWFKPYRVQLGGGRREALTEPNLVESIFCPTPIMGWE